MVSEVYRKVGRGGAGNIYSPQDLKNIEESLKVSCLEELFYFPLLRDTVFRILRDKSLLT